MRRGRAICFYTIPSGMGHDRYAEHEHHLLSNQLRSPSAHAATQMTPFLSHRKPVRRTMRDEEEYRVPKVESPSQLIDARIREVDDWRGKKLSHPHLYYSAKRRTML